MMDLPPPLHDAIVHVRTLTMFALIGIFFTVSILSSKLSNIDLNIYFDHDIYLFTH